MSIFRTPKGTYTRSTPDWFSGLSCSGFGFDRDGAPASPAVGLFNNDNAGRALYVFGIGAAINGSSEYGNVSLFNGPLTNLYSPTAAAPIDPRIGALPGQIQTSLTALQVTKEPVTTQQGLYLLMGGSPTGFTPHMDTIVAEHPIAIVPAGFTLAVWTFNFGLGAWFNWVVLGF